MKKFSLFIFCSVLCVDLIASASYNSQQNQADQDQHNSLDDLRQKIMTLENELASIRNRMFSDPNYVYNPSDIDYAMKLSKQVKSLEQEIQMKEAAQASVQVHSQIVDQMDSWDREDTPKTPNFSFSKGDDFLSSREGESPASEGASGDRMSRASSSSSLDNWEVVEDDTLPTYERKRIELNQRR